MYICISGTDGSLNLNNLLEFLKFKDKFRLTSGALGYTRSH